MEEDEEEEDVPLNIEKSEETKENNKSLSALW